MEQAPQADSTAEVQDASIEAQLPMGLPESEQAQPEQAQPEQAQPEQAQPEQAQSSASPPVAPASTPAVPDMTPVPATPQYTPEQISKMQKDAAQYEQVQMRTQIQQQADTYKKQLESQGFLPEHADHAANYYIQSQQQQMTLMQQAEQYGQYVQGMHSAAEKFAVQYKLSIEDLATLRQSQTPEAMEQTAKKMAADRERDDELARFRQSKVPAQNFDNSQGNPQVAANEGSWLDRYNDGDRSPSAISAAKRAAGLG